MIVLDTNVVSETMRVAPNPQVVKWLDRQIAETLYLSSVSVAELLSGISVLPVGKRRERLRRAFEGIRALFADRVLPFDETAAERYADLAETARKNGFVVSLADGYIAAIAASHGFVVASRDVKPFQAANVPVVDPWRS